MSDWNEKNNKHTLIIYRRGGHNSETFKLSGMIQIQDPQGRVWFETFPLYAEALQGMVFDEILFEQPQGASRDPEAGALALNHFNPDVNINGPRQ